MWEHHKEIKIIKEELTRNFEDENNNSKFLFRGFNSRF